MLPVLIALGVLAVGYWLLVLKTKSRHVEMATDRVGVNLQSFVKEFEGTPYCRSAIEAAYGDLFALCRLPIRRSDEIEKTLCVLREDFDYTFEKRCQGLGLTDVWKSPHASLFPLNTAEDYVRFLSAVMSEQGKSLQQK